MGVALMCINIVKLQEIFRAWSKYVRLAIAPEPIVHWLLGHMIYLLNIDLCLSSTRFACSGLLFGEGSGLMIL